MRRPALVTWAIYLLLIPLYIFPSGLPQPGDLLVLLVIPLALQHWNGKLGRDMRSTMRALIWFTLWVVAVDLTWMFLMDSFTLSGPDAFLLFPLYYIYNALIFLAALVLVRRHGDLFLRVTVFAVTLTVYAQVLASIALGWGGNRGTLFFNNPNQLGYYALLAATLIALTHRRLQLRLVTSSLTLVCCGVLAVISASRAAAGGVAVLLVFLLFSNPKILVAACLAGAAVVSGIGPFADAIEASQDRVLNRGAHSDASFFQERGYDRIWRNQQYLLLGAGEGGLSRFDDTAYVKGMEIHSSAGTILFSYGIVGVLLFLGFTWRLIRGAGARLVITMLPPLLYTGAHQGLRFTTLWVVLAVFVALKADPDRRRLDGRLGAM
ncbi:MAG TPA: hypothetical protein VHT91_23585 [Kofleriaceae bacterium]|jgi:hypothetical protein|nr:hypothetical protein [Kofleriaceae bacterium]